MELIVLLVFFLAIGVAATRWGVDTREAAPAPATAASGVTKS